MRRDVCVVLLAVGAALAPGCYCSHELHPDAGMDVDAGTGTDARMPDDVPMPVDHGSPMDGAIADTCVSRCAEPEVVASADLTGDYDWATTVVDVTATDGAIWLLLDRNLGMPPTEMESVYVLFRYDLATHGLASMDVPTGMRTHPPMRAGDVRTDGDALRVVALTTPLNTFRRRDLGLATATWDATGAVTAEDDMLAMAPFMLSPSMVSDAVVFGRDALDFAAFSEGAIVHAWVVDRASTAAPTLVDLVTLTDSGPLEPLSGAVLDDGRVVVAGGGPADSLARTPFLAVGALADAPLATMPIVGEPYDPPPLVVAESGDGFALVRAASDPTDVGTSAIHFQHFDGAATLASESVIPTLGGLQPVALATLAVDGHAGLVWAERVFGTPTGVSLRMLWPGTDDPLGCPTLHADPIVHVDTTLRSLLAVQGSDGAVYLVTLGGAPIPGLTATLAVRRVETCAVAH